MRLTRGIREASRQNHFTYPSEWFDARGLYAEPLRSLDRFLRRYWPQKAGISSFRYGIALRLIHECEEAKSWLSRVRADGEDFEAANVRHREQTSITCQRAIKAIETLIECDKASAYYLRSAFAVGLCSSLNDQSDIDYVMGDANRDDGGLHVKLDGERRHVVETQAAMRLAYSELDIVLEATRERLESHGKNPADPWYQIGNIRLNPALSRRARAKIVKDSDMWLGIAVFGLSISLSAWFRAWSLNPEKSMRWVGEVVTPNGRPWWNIVADFVNTAFQLRSPETEESLRQRASVICKGREVRVMNWPGGVVREPQVQKD
jgi:hypothetical protein